jgi:hypothetical protein
MTFPQGGLLGCQPGVGQGFVGKSVVGKRCQIGTGVIPIHDLDGLWIEPGHDAPNPFGTVRHKDQFHGLVGPMGKPGGPDQIGKVLGGQ